MKTIRGVPEHSMRSAFSRSVNDELVRFSAAHAGARRIVCECSRRRCTEMLEVTIGDYEAVRAHPTRFLVAPGHALASVQRVVTQTRRVGVVQEHQECLRLQTEAVNGKTAGNRTQSRVLVVEDDPLMSELWSATLESTGLEVLQAPDGLRALARARREWPALVLTDVRMPGLDGFQLAEALRRGEQTRRIPLIFLSGETDAAAADRAYAIGAVAYLTKPCDPWAVASLVAGVLARFPRREPRRPEAVKLPRRGDSELVA